MLRYACRFFFPDSPANAWFLTAEERVIAVERIKVNQAGVENKHFKVEQCVSTWLAGDVAQAANETRGATGSWSA